MPFSATSEAGPGHAVAVVDPNNPGPVDVWFLHVGHGDCTIVRHADGRVTVIDTHLRRSLADHAIDVVADSTGLKEPLDMLRAFADGGLAERPTCTDVVSFLRWLGAQEVYRLVLTHPDLDHLRGLARLRMAFPIRNLWDTHNLKWIAPDGFGHEADGIDWAGYQLLRFGKAGTVVLRLVRGAKGDSWTRDGLAVLAPAAEDIVEANRTGGWNCISYVVKLTHGAASVMFTGDAQPATLERLMSEFGTGLRSNILKAPHHGRRSGWCSRFVRAVAPGVTVVSSGAKAPGHDALAAYKRVSPVLATHREGTIGFRLHWNGTVERLRPASAAQGAESVGRALRTLGRLLDA